MEGVQTVDVSWLHHSQKGKSHFPCSALSAAPCGRGSFEDWGGF